jgi:hypothetical protein
MKDDPMINDPYVGAPALVEQSAQLADMFRTINEKGLDCPDPLIREFLLGQAAYNDRLHLADPEISADDYLTPALDLITYDRRYFTWSPAGPGPDSNTWSGDNGMLEYVRAQWLTAQQNARR